MNCVVPSDFYPFEVENENKKPDYIDGEGLIGETITVKAYNDDLIQDYNMRRDLSRGFSTKKHYISKFTIKQ